MCAVLTMNWNNDFKGDNFATWFDARKVIAAEFIYTLLIITFVLQYNRLNCHLPFCGPWGFLTVRVFCCSFLPPLSSLLPLSGDEALGKFCRLILILKGNLISPTKIIFSALFPVNLTVPTDWFSYGCSFYSTKVRRVVVRHLLLVIICVSYWPFSVVEVVVDVLVRTLFKFLTCFVKPL